MITSLLDRRPVVVAVAGPNGAGKSTFYEARLRFAGLRFVNADDLARELGLPPYDAAALADQVRRALAEAKESFIFETVLSDPHGEKVAFLRELSEGGYNVLLCFIGLDSVALSDERVAIRAAQGGHDVPREKLEARFERTLRNLRRAIEELPYVVVFDNSAFGRPHRQIAETCGGQLTWESPDLPLWFRPIRDDR